MGVIYLPDPNAALQQQMIKDSKDLFEQFRQGGTRDQEKMRALLGQQALASGQQQMDLARAAEGRNVTDAAQKKQVFDDALRLRKAGASVGELPPLPPLDIEPAADPFGSMPQPGEGWMPKFSDSEAQAQVRRTPFHELGPATQDHALAVPKGIFPDMNPADLIRSREDVRRQTHNPTEAPGGLVLGGATRGPNGDTYNFQTEDEAALARAITAQKAGLQGTSKPPTENEAKARLNLSTMLANNAKVTEMEKQGLAPTGMGSWIQGNKFFPDAVKSDSYRTYMGEARNWSANYLYQLSGASATPEEVQSTMASYFAQPGDTAERIQAKAAKRQIVQSSFAKLGRLIDSDTATPADVRQISEDPERQEIREQGSSKRANSPVFTKDGLVAEGTDEELAALDTTTPAPAAAPPAEGERKASGLLPWIDQNVLDPFRGFGRRPEDAQVWKEDEQANASPYDDEEMLTAAIAPLLYNPAAPKPDGSVRHAALPMPRRLPDIPADRELGVPEGRNFAVEPGQVSPAQMASFLSWRRLNPNASPASIAAWMKQFLQPSR